MIEIKLFDSVINPNDLNAKLQTKTGDMKTVDLQGIIAMIENGQMDDVLELLTNAGLSARFVEENGATKIMFTLENKEYSIVYNPASEDVGATAGVNNAPGVNSFVSSTVVNAEDNEFTKEEIHKLGFISEKDLQKYFDCKNGVYSLKTGLIIDGKNINSIQELMDTIGAKSLDDFIEDVYGDRPATDLATPDNWRFTYRDPFMWENDFKRIANGTKTLEQVLKDAHYGSVVAPANSMLLPSTYIYELYQDGYITDEDFPTDDYNKALEYIKDAFERYHTDLSNKMGKSLKDLTTADVVRDLYTRHEDWKISQNSLYRDYIINNVYTHDVDGDARESHIEGVYKTDQSYIEYQRGESGVGSYFGEILRLANKPYESPMNQILSYVATISEDRNFENGPIKAIYKAAGVTEGDSIEEKQNKIWNLLYKEVGTYEDKEYGYCAPYNSLEELYLWLYDNGYIEQATYSADEIKLIGNSLHRLGEDGNFYNVIDGELSFYQDGVDKDGNPIYKATHKIGYDKGFDGVSSLSRAQAIHNGYSIVSNAQELLEALKQSKPILLTADIDMSSVKEYLYIGTESNPYPETIYTNGYTLKNLNGEVHIDKGNVCGQNQEWNKKTNTSDLLPWYTYTENIDKSNPVYLPPGTQAGTIGTAILYNYVHTNGYDGTTPLDYVYDKNGNKVSITDGNWFEVLTHPDDYILPGEYSIPDLAGPERAKLIQQAFDKLWNNSFDIKDSACSLDMSGNLDWPTAIITSMGGTIVRRSGPVMYSDGTQGQSLITFELDGHTYTISLQNIFANKNFVKTISAKEADEFLDKYNMQSIKQSIFQLFKKVDNNDIEYSINPSLFSYVKSLNIDYLDSDGNFDLSKVEQYVVEYINKHFKLQDTASESQSNSSQESIPTLTNPPQQTQVHANTIRTETVQNPAKQVTLEQTQLKAQVASNLATDIPEISQKSKVVVEEFILESLTPVDNFSIDEDMLDNLVYDADSMIGDTVRSLNKNVDNINDLLEKYMLLLTNQIKIINKLFIQHKELITQNPDIDIYKELDNIDTKSAEILKDEFGLSDYEFNEFKHSVGQYILSKIGSSKDLSSIEIIEFIRDYIQQNTSGSED